MLLIHEFADTCYIIIIIIIIIIIKIIIIIIIETEQITIDEISKK